MVRKRTIKRSSRGKKGGRSHSRRLQAGRKGGKSTRRKAAEAFGEDLMRALERFADRAIGRGR